MIIKRIKDIVDEFKIQMLKTKTENKIEALKQTEKMQRKIMKKLKN